MSTTDNALETSRLEVQDLLVGLGALVFAFFSLLWPDTGMNSIFGLQVEHGYVAASVFALVALVALVLAPKIGSAGPVLQFLRRFYPQAALLPFFSESILLSSRVFGGFSHDPFFAGLDQAIFGFQPSIEFSRAFGNSAVMNELMFGAYFAYFVIMVITPWLSWFKGDKAEAKRQMFIFAALYLSVDLFYVFFRVQGPKYWFPELREAWYGNFQGGLFVAFFQNLFATTTLYGAAFPSTHVLLTIFTLRCAYRTDKRLFAAYLPLTVLIILATVYIYAHYAVDAVGGLAVALLLPPLFERARPRLEAVCEKMSFLGAPATR